MSEWGVTQLATVTEGRVDVVGIGAQTPVGRTAAATAAAVRAGLSRFEEHPFMTNAKGDTVRVSSASWLSPDLSLTERVEALLIDAVDEALSPLLTITPDLGRTGPAVGITVGVSEDRPGLVPRFRDKIASVLLSSLRARFPGLRVEVLTPGHAAGVMAIERGCQLISDGAVEFCLAGGADSHISPENLLALEERHQLHGGNNSWGFVPGEAAGFCLLAARATTQRYRLRPLLEIIGVAVTTETNTARSRAVCTGVGLSQAVAKVLRSGEKVGVIVSDQNGEPYRADELGFTLARHARRFDAPPNFWAPAASWGDVGAASVPLFVGLIVASALRGYAAGDCSLLLASSETEERGAVLLRLASSSGQ